MKLLKTKLDNNQINVIKLNGYVNLSTDIRMKHERQKEILLKKEQMIKPSILEVQIIKSLKKSIELHIRIVSDYNYSQKWKKVTLRFRNFVLDK